MYRPGRFSSSRICSRITGPSNLDFADIGTVLKGRHVRACRQERTDTAMTKLVIQIPCYNEEQTLGVTMGDLPRDLKSAEEGAFAGVPLLGASADFKSACKMGDTIEVESWVEEWHPKTFVVAHCVHNGDRIAVTAREKRIWVIRDSSRPAGIRSAPIPPEIRAQLSAA